MQVYNHNDIKQWYQATYPDDDLGANINDDLDWERLWGYLVEGYDIYQYLGEIDSIVRERIFGELADMLKVPYDVVYYTWLDDQKKALKALLYEEMPTNLD